MPVSENIWSDLLPLFQGIWWHECYSGQAIEGVQAEEYEIEEGTVELKMVGVNIVLDLPIRNVPVIVPPFGVLHFAKCLM